MFNFNASSAFDSNGQPKPAVTRTVDTVLKAQRPLVLSLLKKMRQKHPQETPQQIAKRLEKAYLRDVTVGGGAVGATAFVPGLGTITSLGLSALAVGGYMERTAVYAQAMAELHGVHVDDPEKARLMVMAIMLGEDGSVLMNSILAHTGKTGGASRKWGMMMGSKDSGKIFSIERTIRNMFFKRFLARQSGALMGRALPFGIGAVVGGGANLALGKNVVKAVEETFGSLPAVFPDALNMDRAPKFVAEQESEPAAGSSSAEEAAQLDS
ncbi:di- and tripeptidase [Rothia sp. CCM 9417]|uniref:di- and tripeptidase n=1 Tax=unclassified Rothia (in: high G+C Gram-positive bacteria) TaxID=2689056 RepID=UPI003AC1224C